MARSEGLVKRRAIVAGSAIALVLFGVAARPYALGLSLVVRAANLHGLARRAADLYAVAETERLVRVPVAHTSIRARVYAPSRTSRQTVLLVLAAGNLGHVTVRRAEEPPEQSAGGKDRAVIPLT